MLKNFLIAMLVLAIAIPLATAASVTPYLFENWQSGNAEFECEQAGGCGNAAYKIDNWNETTPGVMDGEYVHAGNTITISNSDNKTFDWSSEYQVCRVIVKAGTDAYLYNYTGAYSDTGLVAPEGKDISHVTFCFTIDTEIPEFPTVALPVAAILGLAFIFLRKKE
ncbi:hypothetical protein J2755_000730 [Methanohalophilus levihalophilus]|uniref:PEF-CTERM sorting domain-containing protein n=1 Tax=Methanohalophilus levihalophilus TaxID=1431282 RepID=UPI001FD89E78|nr:PEF-CTERM sorting domain-containing protein [Methanohalophilus levihalophilus]MBP2029810.1 hypothetical protein [Methanohalophilus levihalophilus]